MRRRLIGIALALVLATGGTLALVQYVRSAEDRALAGERLAPVLVVDAPIPAGTPVEDLGGRLRPEEVPVKVRAADAVSDLAPLGGLVTAVDLVPGEQLVLARLVQPDMLRTARPVPPGMVELTVPLLPTRALGGQLTPGDTVAVLASFDPFDLDGVVIAEDPAGPANEPVTAAPARTPNTTHIIVHKVVVTSIQAAPAEPAEDGAASPIPPGELLVTLAVTPADAERVVFSAEFGLLWLARQGADVPEAGTRVQTRASVYEPTGGRAQ